MPGVRVQLVPVQPEQLQPLTVQVEAVGLERCFAEPDPSGQRVAAHTGKGHCGAHGVQLRVLRGPQDDRAQPGEAQAGRGDAGLIHTERSGPSCDLPVAVEQLHQQRAAGVRRQGRIYGALHVYPPPRSEHIGRQGEQVGQECLRKHPERDVAVDPAGLEEVDAGRHAAVAHRRHRQAVGVHQDREQIVPRADVAGQLGRERQVPALVGADCLVVDHHRCVDHDPVEVDHDPVSWLGRTDQRSAAEVAPVDPHLLPCPGVPVAP